VVKANEIIASMLITWHNLVHYQRLMAGLRNAIVEGSLREYASALLSSSNADDDSVLEP
jgi:queuine tRNA-ribosyltransferase